MTERIVESLNHFSNYYQKTLLRRLIVGLVVGSLLYLSIFILTNILILMQNDTVWWGTFLHDLPLVGAILALLVSLQIWGLLPQPTDNKQSTEVGNEDPNKEKTDSEKKYPEDSE
ncbi:MAG: hypothetical protein ACFFAE_09915 [Candidatus Hodarchaeota archaeon]